MSHFSSSSPTSLGLHPSSSLLRLRPLGQTSGPSCLLPRGASTKMYISLLVLGYWSVQGDTKTSLQPCGPLYTSPNPLSFICATIFMISSAISTSCWVLSCCKNCLYRPVLLSSGLCPGSRGQALHDLLASILSWLFPQSHVFGSVVIAKWHSVAQYKFCSRKKEKLHSWRPNVDHSQSWQSVFLWYTIPRNHHTSCHVLFCNTGSETNSVRCVFEQQELR